MIKSHKSFMWSCFVIILMLTLFLCWQNSSDSTLLTVEACGVVRIVLSAVNIQTEYSPIFHILTRKIGHLLIFVILSISCYGAFGTSIRSRKSVIVWSLICGIVIAVMAEYMQQFFGNREARIYDAIINVCGIMIGNYIAFKLLPHFKSKHKSPRKYKTA